MAGFFKPCGSLLTFLGMQLFKYDRLRSRIERDKHGRHEFVDLGDCSNIIDEIFYQSTMSTGSEDELQKYQVHVWHNRLSQR